MTRLLRAVLADLFTAIADYAQHLDHKYADAINDPKDELS